MTTIFHKPSSFSIRTKLIILTTLIIIYSIASSGYQEYRHTTALIEGEALQKVQSDLQMGYEIIDLKYPGAWHVDNGQLYKGETLINDNYEIVDDIGEMTNGDTATIFLGDTRVTTNVMVEGKRAVGTQVSEVIAQKVLQKGEIYLGQANVVGHTYQSAYMPIKDSEGTIIGIWYLGAPDSNERVQEIKRNMLLDILMSAIIILGIALVLIYFLTRPIINRIKASVHSLQTVANGDLTHDHVQVKSNDETGMLMRSVNQMTKELRTLLTSVRDMSLQVAASSEQLTASADQTSKATQQISYAIQDVAVGSETQLKRVNLTNEAGSEISRGMDQASQLIQTMADFSAKANDDAQMGAKKISHTMEQMQLIQQTVEDTAVVVHNLGEQTKEIDQIVAVISEMAKQTNLLALNAAIEAARAGEQGKGFAVVASEVRKLADQSRKSALEVSELIGHIQEGSNKAVQSMSNGTTVVQQGIEQITQSGVVFEEIASAIEEISSQSQEVAAIVQQVNANSDEMVNSMKQVSEISQESTESTQNIAAVIEEQNASMQEISASATHLTHMAEELQLLIEKFKL